MIEVDGGRSVAIHPPNAAPTGFGQHASRVVADNLDELLGEQLLPLRARSGDEDEPHLLAVDASGQPVVVEIVGRLDRPAIMRALTYAGRAAQMSTQDLARAYRGGEERFSAHLEAFRETVPATALLSTSVRPGSRLLLVCAEIADDVEDALEFLLQPGWQVQLLQVGVVRSPDGQRIVDVLPLTRRAPARRAMEPTLRLVRSHQHGSGVPSAASADTVTWTASHPVAPSYGSYGSDSYGSWDSPGGAAWTSSHAVVTPSDGTSAVDPHRHPASVIPRPAPVVVPPPFARQAERVAAPVPEPDGRLLEAAREIGGRTPLVWFSAQRGEWFTVTLREDGLLELPDGSLHGDPDTAAAAACGSSDLLDGWRLWRFGYDGPTLAEAFGL